MSQPIVQIDAFTATPFTGNPAAVCLLTAPREDSWMQQVALEMNLAETAFLLPAADGDGFHLRWFTPTTEVSLCGHATLASAHMLWESGRLAPTDTARFHTRSGLLTAARAAGSDWIELDFPATPFAPTDMPATLPLVLGSDAPVRFVGRSTHGYDLLVELGGEDLVRTLRPDLGALLKIGLRGMIVTSRADVTPAYDFVSRYFAPGWGVLEDPVTGSAHCTLTPYWSSLLGQERFTAYQASARGGVVRTRLAGARVILSGQAVTVLRGMLV